MPDIQMADGVVVRFPDDLDPAKITDFINKRTEQINLEKGNEATRGTQRGTATTKALIGKGIPAISKSLLNKAAEAIGVEPVADPTEEFKAYQEAVQKAYIDYPTKYKTFKDVKDLSSAGGYIAASAGEQVPQLMLSLGSGAVGGTIGKMGMKMAAQKVGRNLTDKEITNAFLRGTAIAGVGSEAAQVVPESYFNLLQQGTDDPLAAVVAGGLKAGIGFLPEMQLFKKLMGPDVGNIVADNLLKRIGKQALETGAQEAVTESAQEFIDQLTSQLIVKPNEDLFSKDNITSLVDNGLKGLIGGAMGGGVVAPFMNGPTPMQIRDQVYEGMPEEERKQLFQAIPIPDDPVSPSEIGDRTNITDTSITPPLYYGLDGLAAADMYGINKESLSFITPTEESISKMLETGIDGTIANAEHALSLADVYGQNTNRDELGRFVPLLTTRLKGIREGKRTDSDYIVGDGEILAKPPEVTAQEMQEGLPDQYPLMSRFNNPARVLQLQDTDLTYAAINANLQKQVPYLPFGPNKDMFDKLTERRGSELKNINDDIKETMTKIDTMANDLKALMKRYDQSDLAKLQKYKSLKSEDAFFIKTLKNLINRRDSLMNQRDSLFSAPLYEDSGKEVANDFLTTAQKLENARLEAKNQMRLANSLKNKRQSSEQKLKKKVPDHSSYSLAREYNLYKTPEEIQTQQKLFKDFGDTRLADKLQTVLDNFDLVKEYADFHRQEIDAHNAWLKAQDAKRNYDYQTKYQKQKYTPKEGSLEEAILEPKILANNLKAMELTPEAKIKYKDLLKGFQRIVNEIFGQNVANVQLFHTLIDGVDNNPVFGAQFYNTLALAINPTTVGHRKEALLHEVWHMAEQLGLVKDAEQHTDMLIDYLAQDPYLRNIPYEELMKTPRGREEIRANAFGKFAVNVLEKGGLDKAVIVPDIVPKAFRPIYKKLMTMLHKLRNMLRGQKFNSIEDIFKSLYTGERALKNLDNVNYQLKTARLQKIADEYQEQHSHDLLENADRLLDEARTTTNDRFDQIGKMGKWGQYISSFMHAASKEPMTALAFTAFRQKNINFNNYLSKYKDILGDFVSSSPAVRYRLHDLADYCRRTDQKAKLNDEGYLQYKHNDQIITLEDKDLSQKYIRLQMAYREQLNDYEKQLTANAQLLYKDALAGMGNKTINIASLESIKKNFDPETDAKEIEEIVQLQETLSGLNKARSIDYAPRMRYGSWGIKVVDKETGKMVDFFTVENGGAVQNLTLKKNEQLYNAHQLKDVGKQLQERYSNPAKYEVIGDGVQSDFGNLKPFKMNYNKLRGQIDPRFINIEMLSALLHSKEIDAQSFDQLRHELYNSVITKGFKVHFSKDDDVGYGYSKDWDRAMHSSFSGAARFFSGVPHAQFLSKFKTEVEALKDENLQKRLFKYIDYTNSQQEDLQSLRVFNFLWTMGGNISTALLQAYTLPTMTLGQLNMVNPNLVQNAREISRWVGIGSKYFIPVIKGSMAANDGLVAFDFANKTALQKALDAKVMTEQEVVFLIRMSNMLRGNLTEDFVGMHPFETGSLGGQIKKNTNRLGFFLGAPVSMMEQITRFATSMAAFSTLANNPDAIARAEKIYENDYRYQAMKNTRGDAHVAEVLASFMMDNAHATFGKYGRSPYMRGAGGAIFFPFTTYTHQMLEGMVRMYGSGADGKRALGVTLASMFLFGGLMGLPGMELLKETIEALKKELTGVEDDLDLIIREGMYDVTGSSKAGKFMTQGIGRAFLNLDVAKRIGLPVPGTELALAFMGVRDKPVLESFGVAGSIVPQIASAFESFRQGNYSNVLASVMPASAGNLIKAADMVTNGVKTQSDNPQQLLTAEEVKTSTALLKALGIGSDQLASRREELYYGKILPNQRFTLATQRYRNKARTEYTNYRKYEESDPEKATKHFEKYRSLLSEYADFARENGIPPDMKAFNRSVIEGARQRQTAKINLKEVRKYFRNDVNKLQKILETER